MCPNFSPVTAAAGYPHAGHGQLMIFGFDRVTVWLDRPELSIAKELLKKHCAQIEVYVEQMLFQARWKLRIEIFQPTTRCIQLLANALGNDVAAMLTYAEIACDFPANSKKQSLQYRNAFLATSNMRYQRHTVVREKGTFYFGRRTDGENRRNNVLAVYADKPSKLNNAQPSADALPCLHVEWRVTGAAALANHGIVGLEDLIHFDHLRFWDKNILLYLLPKPTMLGRLLGKVLGADANVSGSALRKRAARWKERHSIKENFVMHNALRAMPELKQIFETVLFSEWAKATILLQQDS